MARVRSCLPLVLPEVRRTSRRDSGQVESDRHTSGTEATAFRESAGQTSRMEYARPDRLHQSGRH